MNLTLTCGETLKFIRKWCGISQQELAMRLYTSQQYISKLERCKHFNGRKLDSLLKALNISKGEWEEFRKLPPPPTNKMKSASNAR